MLRARPSSSSSSETVHSSTSCIGVSAGDAFGVSSQVSTTCKSFVLRPLPHVGLNTLMSMKRSVSTSPHSVAHRSLLNANTMVPCSLVLSSATQCHAVISDRNSVADSKIKSEMCACLSSDVAFSSGLLKPASIPLADVTPETDAMFLSTLAATAENSRGFSGHFLSAVSTKASSELLKLPSFIETPDVSSLSVATSATALETKCESFISNVSVVSVSSPSSTWNEVRKTSTPAKRPQSLDVIPWGPLSPSACTLTGSLSTVVHSRVTSSSSRSISAAEEVIPASPVNISAV